MGNPGHSCGLVKTCIGAEPIEHLSILEDVRCVLKIAKPRLTLLTHFGMTTIKVQPRVAGAQWEKELGLTVIAASDGMEINLEEV